jgi:2-polyprenyl-6-methoxyphenol hydroxylase-like FAD-dependent oxidoreductase
MSEIEFFSDHICLIGDFVTIGPSALQAFKRNSTRLADDVYKKAFHPTSTWYQPTGEVGVGPRPFQKNFGVAITRPRLYEALATAVRDANIEVRYHKRINKYFESTTHAGVETDDGEVLRADIIIAADGVHSRSWEVVTGSPPRAYSSGSAVFRAAFPAEQARHNEIIRSKWLLGEDQFSFYIGQDSHAIVVTSSDIITWVWMHSDKFQTSSESWTKTLSSDEALHQLKDAGLEAPELHELIRVTPPNTIVDWQLVWRDLDEDWVSPHGRVVQIGDAAHPFLPVRTSDVERAP